MTVGAPVALCLERVFRVFEGWNGGGDGGAWETGAT